jgi:alpha-tubulin suppressor-like RCC1 family protein
MTRCSRSIPIHQLVLTLAPALVLALAACGDEATSPSVPAPTELAASAPLVFSQVSAGDAHTCGVTATGRAYCWGINYVGQVGDGTTTTRTRPVAVLGGLRFKHVSAGGAYTCGVTTDERVFCWGQNDRGQLGDGTTANRLTPGVVAGNRRFRQVRAGVAHTCAITPRDAGFCWGENSSGSVGDGTNSTRLTPVPVLGELHWRQLSAGGGQTCGVTTADRAYCWGLNGNGELGDGTHIDRLQPRAVAGGLAFRQIEAGGFHTCAVTTADRAYCWGYGAFGQLGDGTTPQTRPTPAPVAGLRRFSHVSAGRNHTCGETVTGRGFCWGGNYSAQLGDGTATNRLIPTALGGVALQLVLVTTGAAHSCGVTTGHLAYCWGGNSVGELGDGTTIQRPEPAPVAPVR